MLFNSIPFLLFFPLVLAVYYSLPASWIRGRNLWLLAASYYFYMNWEPVYALLLLTCTMVTYLSAIGMEKASRTWGRKFCLIMGIVLNMVILFLFKYYDFLASEIAGAIRTIGLSVDLPGFGLLLPVGISFYTFQALSYVIDVHRGKIAAEKDFARLALYISFFPQLVAGPIVRASDFLPQLYEPSRRITAENFCTGIQIMAMGFFKKIVLADHLSVFADDVFGVPLAFHWSAIILAVVSYSLQIYFDFSGYSDIATGCAKCLGYDFAVNFNLPYISRSVTEFWRRWHISLSGWLKDYLYIPLGGNRLGRSRQLTNIMITMLLGGLWHGANWTFIFWGGLNGLALCAEKIFPPAKNKNGIFHSIMKIIAVFVFIAFTWIFFRAETFSGAWAVIRGIFTLQDGIRQPFFWSFAAIVILIVSELAALLVSNRERSDTVRGFIPLMNLNTITGLTVYFVFVGLILGLAFTGENPFVYFQF